MGDLSVNLKTATNLNGAGYSIACSKEQALADQIANGDETAFSEIITLHSHSIAQLIGRLTSWHADSDDILQEVFLVVWQKAHLYRGQGTLEGWIKRIAINRCRNHFRMLASIRRKLEKFTQLVLLPNEQTIKTSFITESNNPELDHALLQLPDTDRMILVLYYLEEMPSQEVAACLKINPNGFHVRLHRARAKLKKELQAQGLETTNE